jgi:phospholipid/cholesterol/gamma-HCH transport system permease protein
MSTTSTRRSVASRRSAADRVPPPLRGYRDAADFFARILEGIVRGRIRLYLDETLRQSAVLVTGSLLVLLGLSLSFGLVVGVEASYAGRLVGAPAAAGAFCAIGDLREICPYALGYMMAAKVSTGYVAEIGTMRISEEIDALEVMGMQSLVYLCSTRLLATWVVLPFVFALSVLMSFIGSFISVVLEVAQVSAGGYLELFWKFQSPQDYLFAGAKCAAMATWVVLVGCYYGYTVRGGPVEVGRATAKAMMVNLLGVQTIGIIGSQLFWGGSPKLPIGG